MNSKRINKWMMLAIAGIVLLSASCKKDKPVLELPPLPTIWEIANGKYYVYDTIGNFLYEMKIIHWQSKDENGKNIDSLRIENFDSEFTFSAKQLSPNPDNFPNHIRFGAYDTLYDSQGKRWKLNAAGMFDEYNNLKNDTILLKFKKTNINYYLHDLTPYYACDCKQVAVKQH